MSNLKVCEGLEIIGANTHQLEDFKKTSNTLEFGASQILEGLSLFAEELLDKYEYEPTVPYDKLFFALKQIITSGAESQDVRDAILTGIITETKDGVPVARQKKEIEIKPVVTKVKTVVERNKSAITKYSKTHNAQEIADHFGFNSVGAARDYLNRNKIFYVKRKSGKPSASNFDINKVRLLAKDMRLCELTRFYGVTKRQMLYFCQQNNIQYKGRIR